MSADASPSTAPRRRTRILLAVWGALTLLTLLAGGVFAYHRHVQRSLADERHAVLQPLEARLIALCEERGAWPTREAGPLLPTHGSWSAAPGFEVLGDDPAPRPRRYALQMSPGFRRAVLRIELVGLPETPAEDSWHTRRCVRDADGCHCRTPLLSSKPELRAPHTDGERGD